MRQGNEGVWKIAKGCSTTTWPIVSTFSLLSTPKLLPTFFEWAGAFKKTVKTAFS